VTKGSKLDEKEKQGLMTAEIRK